MATEMQLKTAQDYLGRLPTGSLRTAMQWQLRNTCGRR